MNISDKNPWVDYWNKGGFLRAGLPEPTRPSDAALQAALMGGTAATSGALRQPGVTGPTVQQGLVDVSKGMSEFKRRKAPQRPQGFDMGGAMNQLGGPPQRAPLPDRPGPDRSAGSVIAQMLAGASDVAGAAGGMRTGNLQRMQEIGRQQQDVRYQDDLRKAAMKHENDMQGWNFQLAKLGQEQAVSDRGQQRFESDRGFQMSEDDRFANDLTREMDRQYRDRTRGEDVGFRDRQANMAKEFADQDRAFKTKAWDAGAPGREFGLSAAQAKEGREKEMHSFQMDQLRRQYGGGDIGKFKELVSATIGVTPNKEQAASALFDKIDPKDPQAAAKMQIIRDELRRGMPQDTARDAGTGLWSDIVTNTPILNLPYHGMNAIDQLFSGQNLLGPEAERGDQRQEQIERLIRMRRQGIPMEGFGPTR